MWFVTFLEIGGSFTASNFTGTMKLNIDSLAKNTAPHSAETVTSCGVTLSQLFIIQLWLYCAIQVCRCFSRIYKHAAEHSKEYSPASPGPGTWVPGSCQRQGRAGVPGSPCLHTPLPTEHTSPAKTLLLFALIFHTCICITVKTAE